MILAALALEKVFSAAQDFEDLLKLDAQLLDDLLALADVALGFLAGQALAGTADGETLIVQQAPNLPDDQNVLALIIAAIAASLDGLELRELLFPIPEDMRLYRTKIADFTDCEISLAWYWR